MACGFCGWHVGHDMYCPCDVPKLIEAWKRGSAQAFVGGARECSTRDEGEREAFFLGYDYMKRSSLVRH
jgi:hypothetical protein